MFISLAVGRVLWRGNHGSQAELAVVKTVRGMKGLKRRATPARRAELAGSEGVGVELLYQAAAPAAADGGVDTTLGEVAGAEARREMSETEVNTSSA
jgi:hypothetical protein